MNAIWLVPATCLPDPDLWRHDSRALLAPACAPLPLCPTLKKTLPRAAFLALVGPSVPPSCVSIDPGPGLPLLSPPPFGKPYFVPVSNCP